MIYRLLKKFDSMFHFEQAHAHCDIPCGIYDPFDAQIAVLTVIRMIDLAEELQKEHKQHDPDFHNSLSRHVAVKEQYAEKCKHEIRVIWGDYITKKHTDQFPELPSLVHEIFSLASEAKQSMDRATGEKLLKSVNRFAKIFWGTKDVKTKLAKTPYEPKEQLVYPAL